MRKRQFKVFISKRKAIHIWVVLRYTATGDARIEGTYWDKAPALVKKLRLLESHPSTTYVAVLKQKLRG